MGLDLKVFKLLSSSNLPQSLDNLTEATGADRRLLGRPRKAQSRLAPV
jgi:hypothetical protein